MIIVEHKVSVRQPDKPNVIMAYMDYLIICRVLQRLTEIGMSDEELSFLLGKPNNHIFSFLIAPTDKNRFKEDQLDLLPHLLQCHFSRILSNDTTASNIQLHHAAQFNDKEFKGYTHIIYDANGNGTRVIWKKKIAPKGSSRKTNMPLMKFLKTWIAQGYFNEERDALQIYNKLKAECDIPHSISDIEKCIKVLCGTKAPILKKEIKKGILKYSVLDIEKK